MDQIGLDKIEAKKMLLTYGYNEIIDSSPLSPFKIFFRQFKGNFLLYTLCLAALLSIIIGKTTTGYSILGVVVLIIITSFMQEYRAEKAVKLLQNLVVPFSTVLREGKTHQIASRELVPGDIVFLNTGDRIPADCIILDASSLKVDESVLTGESEPVNKNTATEAKSDQIQDINKLFMGSHIIEGKCCAKIAATGMSTEFGKIAKIVSATDKDIPLQKKVDKIAKYMATVAIISAVANGLLLLRGLESITTSSLVEIFTVVIALAVSAIPEGLPVVLTTTLATGSYRMAKKNAVINRMSVIETLGETTVICSDKTGTLTTGVMTAKKIYCNNITYDINGAGLVDKGDFLLNGRKIDKGLDETLNILCKASLVCNDATDNIVHGHHLHAGSPTEVALHLMANKWGYNRENIRGKKIDEIPFNSERKKMSVAFVEDESEFVFCKGAVEYVVGDCSSIMINGKTKPFTSLQKEILLQKNHEFTSNGFRSIALAYKKHREEDEHETGLIFLGIVGLQDAPRAEVKGSIETCLSAGIKVKMITGDNLQTALAIASQVGITGKYIEGNKIDSLSDSKLQEIVKETAVFARVRPEHKLRIVKALKENGEIVAMTGDGINDAPALKEAHIGIAMGKNGTDVTRSVADITLKDDNFATIVAAIKEGRAIFSNIRKFVTCQLSCNYAQLVIIFISTAFGLPLPLLALQILFINLIADTLTSISLGFNPPSSYIMKSAPRKKSELFDKGTLKWIMSLGSVIIIGTLGVYYILLLKTGWNVDLSRTVAFLTLIFFAILNAFNFKSFHIPVTKTSIFSNKFLFYSLLISAAGAYLIINTGLNKFFETVPLSLEYWLLSIAVAISVILVADATKYFIAYKRNIDLSGS